MFKTVIPNVFYVMHILKLTFIFNFALIGQLHLTKQILQWESIMYISSSTICCCAYFNLSRFKLSVNTWPLNVSKRPKMITFCYQATSSGHFEEIGHFLGCSSSNFGGSKTIKSRWAENQKIQGFKWIWFILMTHLSLSHDSKYMSLICLVNITLKLYYIQKQKIQ